MSATNGHRKLTAEEILGLGAADLEIKEVMVPEWGGSVHLRVLPADEGLELNERMQGLPKERESEALFLLLGACLVDSSGAQLFSSDQIAGLRKRSQKVLVRLQRAALALQGWVGEEAEKNG
jgi:hypothetical protein